VDIVFLDRIEGHQEQGYDLVEQDLPLP